MLSGTPRAASDFNAATNQYKPASGVNDFDTSGNMTKFGSVLMEYDYENRLTKTTVNGAVTTRVYDGEGRRVKKVMSNRTEVFVYDVFGSLAAEYGTWRRRPRRNL